MSTFVSAKLLDAAVATIRHRGYAGSSVDDICRAAGVSNGALFPHFYNKDELDAAAAAHFSVAYVWCKTRRSILDKTTAEQYPYE